MTQLSHPDSPRRRALLFLLLVALTAALTACRSSPYRVEVPRAEGLGDAVISLQMTFRKSPLGFVSPRGRYAEKLGPKLHNRLLEEGFVIKRETADLHVVAQVYEITTGGTARTARCDLRLDIYDSWPGDLSEKRAKIPKGMKAIFSMMVSSEKKTMTNGYPRDQLADAAADQCLADLVSYLVRSKSQPMR